MRPHSPVGLNLDMMYFSLHKHEVNNSSATTVYSEALLYFVPSVQVVSASYPGPSFIVLQCYGVPSEYKSLVNGQPSGESGYTRLLVTSYI